MQSGDVRADSSAVRLHDGDAFVFEQRAIQNGTLILTTFSTDIEPKLCLELAESGLQLGYRFA